MAADKFGRYEIKSELGQGGMATVYLANDPLFGRDVALKVMSSVFRSDPTFRGRFEREARTIATLEHPAIVPVYDFGEDQGQPYLVMRYMPGGSLADRIAMGPVSLQEALRIVRPISEALDHAHSRGVIHRDLKPGNILFDQYGHAFLSDFGIVKLAEATASLTGSGVIGTPAYMSPEQVHGEDELDGRSDIYTLGIILFEMLTGRKPYRADTPVKLMMAHVLNPVPSILAVRPELPPGCEMIIQKSLSKDRDTRYRTAEEMASALMTITGEIVSPGRSTAQPEEKPPPQTASFVDATETAVKAPAQTPQEPTVTVGTAAGGEEATVAPLPPRRSGRRWWFAGGILILVLIAALFLVIPAIVEMAAETETPTVSGPEAAVLPPKATPQAIADATGTAENVAGPTALPTSTATRVTATPTPPALETVEIGRSAGGEMIEAVQFGSGANVVVFVGGIHAGFAPASVELAEMGIEHFRQNPEEIPEEITLYIISLANPDAPPDPGNLPGRLNANGVDLNRNWDCKWQETTQWRSSESPEAIGGPEPFSEPETESLAQFMLEQEPVAVVFWQALALDGLVSPGSCEAPFPPSDLLAATYAFAAGYPTRALSDVNGDVTNWLAQQEIPAISVLLPDYDESDFENNLAGMRAVLQLAVENEAES